MSATSKSIDKNPEAVPKYVVLRLAGNEEPLLIRSAEERAKNYNAFLQAFQNGEVKRLVVVAR